MADPKNRSYLDFNASAPLLPEVQAAIAQSHNLIGNPSSVHQDGRQVRALIEDAREAVAMLVNCKSSNVTFTSGGTEANAMAIEGLLKSNAVSTVLCSAVEHPSVLDHVEQDKRIPVDKNGLVIIDRLIDLLSQCDSPALVCVMYANNETGIIQPIEKVCEIVHEYDGTVLCDAIQAPGKVDIDIDQIGTDLLSLSAHKIGALQGVGALVNRSQSRLEPILVGGGQERRTRSGTENTLGIITFDAAAKSITATKSHIAMAQLRDGLEESLVSARPEAVVVGQSVARLSNTTNVALPGVTSEEQVINLDLAGFSISAGSACSSGKMAKSHVLQAMGLSDEVVNSAIRISLGPSTTKSELENFVDAWASL